MKKVQSRGLRESRPSPHAQRQGARPPPFTSKTRTRTCSEEQPRKGRDARRQSSSPHCTPLPSPPPPLAAACPSQKTQTAAATLTGGNAGGAPTAVATSSPTLLATDDSEAKDGMRRPPSRRPNSSIVEVSPGAGDETAQQKAPTLQQGTGDRSAPPAVRSRIGRHLAPQRRNHRAASALASPSHASSFPSASDMQSTSSRTCSSASDRDVRAAHRLLQRDSQRNWGRGATPAVAAHPSASSATTKSSKMSWRPSQQQRKRHRVVARGAYSNTSSTSSSSAASPDDTATKSARTSSDSWLSRRKCGIQNNEGNAFPSPPSSPSVEPICVFTDVLPRDVYLHICGFLTEADCCTLLEVSLCMHAAITSADSIVWRHMCVSTWMYKQGFQTFIQHVRALEVLARQEELEVQALQQHMLLLREQGIVFGESDVSATCDCATVLIRRRQHERARWMAAAAAGAATPTLYRSRLTSKVSSAAVSASSATQTESSCVISSTGDRRRRCKSRRCHRKTKRSTTATASTSRRSGNTCGAAAKRPTHAARWAEPSAQRLGSRSTATTATSRASRSRRDCSDGSRDSDGTSESLSRSCSSRTLSSSESSKEETCNGMHHTQTHPPSHHSADDSAAPLRPGGSDAGEKARSATGRPPLPPPPSSTHTHASAKPCEKGRGGFSATLRSTSASDDRGENAYEYLDTEDDKTGDTRERRVRIRLPEAEAEDEGNANLTDTSVPAVRSRGGSRHRRRSRRSLSGSLLPPAHGYRRHRRSHREKRRKPARQRRRKRGRSRGPRSTGGGGGRHRSQLHRGQGRQHRPSHQHHHSSKATKSSRRRRRRQRNAAAAAAAAAQADRDGGSASFYASSQNAALGGGISTYFYQTATYEAIKSTTPVLAAHHVAPSMVPFKLGGRQAPSVGGAEAVVFQSRGEAQRNPHQSCGSEVHACEASSTGALAQPAGPLNNGSDVALRTVSAPRKMDSASQQVASPLTPTTASSAATTFGTGTNEERLYWWQLTPEARQLQLRRMQQLELQQQLAASSDGFTTRTAPSLQDGDELADEAALREWDELEASSLGSSSGTIYEEDADASREGDREEVDSSRNGASVTSDDTEGRSELSTDEDEDEREGSTDSSDYRRHRRRSRKLWRTQSRSTRRSVTSDETTSTRMPYRLAYHQRYGGEPGTSSSASCSSRLHTAPPSLANGESTASECGVDNETERWMRTGVRGAASLLHQRCKSSDATDKRSRGSGDGTGGGRSDGTADRYDSDEGTATTSVVSQADKKLIAGSSSGKQVLLRVRRSSHPYTLPGISVAASVPPSSRLAIRAERRVAKALEKRYEGIEEAMVITRSKSVLIHTLERQTHAHLPRLLAAAQRQHRLMMNKRPAAAAAHHADPSLMSPTVALHRGTPDFSEVASTQTVRAIILIGAGSSGFNGCGTSTTLPAAASLTAPPASHLLSSLDNSFATVTAATLAVPASPLYQLARTGSSNVLTNSSSERGGGLSGTLPCEDNPHSSPPSTSTASLAVDTAGNGGSVATAPRALLQGLLERHRMAATAAAVVGGNGVRGSAPSSASGAPMQPANDDEAVDDDDDEEEQFAPVSWKFAFFMSRREAKRVKITLQDLREGMWVVCFRSSGRTHPIRFVGQHQVFLYPPLPTTEEEEEQRLQQNSLESSEAESEVGHTTTTATATSATSAAPPLPFHILQGGAQLVVHQFPPMKVMRRNGAAPGNAAGGGTPAAVAPVSSANTPAAAAVTPAMMAERRFVAEPQATLRKLRLRMLSSAAHDATTFEPMSCGEATRGLAAAGCAVADEHNGASGRDFGCRDCTSYGSYDAPAVSSTATTNDVRRNIAQELGFCAAYMKEALGQVPARPGEEHISDGATTRHGCSAAPSRAKGQRFFYGPLTQCEYEAQQRRDVCFAPGGPGDVLNDWGWTIASQYVKIFSLDITAPLYVKRLQRVADVEVIGRNHSGERGTGNS